MTSYISHTSIDCRDAFALSAWWKEVLGYVDQPEDPNAPGHQECWIQRPDGGHPLLFIEVPEAKQVKNRIHLDLRPGAGTRDDELGRLLGLGAREVDDRRTPDGRGWVVLADPEDNEFCVLRSEAEVAPDPT
ncbi:VOC family protein [Nocardioides korecus]